MEACWQPRSLTEDAQQLHPLKFKFSRQVAGLKFKLKLIELCYFTLVKCGVGYYFSHLIGLVNI